MRYPNILHTCFEYFRHTWSHPTNITVSTNRKLLMFICIKNQLHPSLFEICYFGYFGMTDTSLLGEKFDVYLYAKKLNLSLTSFLTQSYEIATLVFWKV